MDNLWRNAKKDALKSLVHKMRNQLFDDNIKIVAKPMSTGGLDYKLLHPDYFKGDAKSVRLKFEKLIKE